MKNSEHSHLEWPDYVVIFGYFLFVLTVGLYSSYKSKRSSVKGYFLASRGMHWIPVGASLFASNIGSGHFIGLAGSGAATGIAIGGFELNAIFVLIILGWLFVPVYLSSGVYTIPEYLRLRFGGRRIRLYMAGLALLLYIFTKISADLYAGALFIQLAMGWTGSDGLYVSIVLLLIIAAVFTIAGGLTAVIWTDFVQTILMLAGGFVLMILAFKEVGGYNELIRKYMESEPSVEASAYDSNNKSCSAVPHDAMHLFRSATPGESNLPWSGVVLGITISSIWYWCSDQVIVQRVLASKNLSHAKGGCLLAGYLKILPLYLLVFPGMAARVLYTDRVACSDPDYCEAVCGSRLGCTNIAYAELVIKLMPVGLSGLMLSVMMAALMSSLTSIFNSSSTIFTIDIWTLVRKHASETELLIVGRCSVVILLALSTLWVPVLRDLNTSELFVYTQQVSNFLSPPVTAVFLLALFNQRTNERGAFWGLMTGLVLGLFRFGVEFGFSAPSCGSGDVDVRPHWVILIVDKVHYLHYGVALFVVTGIVTLVISYLTDPIDPKKLYRLTYATMYSTEMREPIDDMDASNCHGEHRADKATKDMPIWEKILYFLCVAKKNTEQDSDVQASKKIEDEEVGMSEEEEIKSNVALLDEKATPRRILTVNAVLLATFATGIWAYYG